MESVGTCDQEMLLADRFLQQVFTGGEMMGTPFKGIGFTGYDNLTRRYLSTWMDSMGMADPGGRTITRHCRHDDPVRGPMTWRSVTRVLDENAREFEMVAVDPEGREERMMAIACERVR